MRPFFRAFSQARQSLVMHHAYFPKTLARYLGRKFILTSLATTIALTGLISLFDFIDVLRRASSHPDVSLWVVLLISTLHAPYYLIYVLPFGMLLGGMTCFSRLSRSSELIVMRAAGLSAWQFLSSPVFCAIMLGVIVSTGLSPLSSIMFRHASQLDNKLLRGEPSSTFFQKNGLWLRQHDTTTTPNGEAILHVSRGHLRGNSLQVEHISLFRLDEHFHLIDRIEASSGELKDHNWQFYNAFRLLPAHTPQALDHLSLPSELTVDRIRTSTTPPDTLSLWALPCFIKLLSRSGFSTIQYRLHFQALLALPLLAGTMALVSAGFSMRSTRRGGVARMLGAGITTGFALFTVSKIAEQLGKSGALPPLLASWAPTGAGLCLAAALLLHMEDG